MPPAPRPDGAAAAAAAAGEWPAVLRAAAPRRAVDAMVPLATYYRSARLLQQQAEVYRRRVGAGGAGAAAGRGRRADDAAQLYFLLLRFLSLVLETVPDHPDFRRGDAAYAALRAHCARVALPESERLKGEVQALFAGGGGAAAAAAAPAPRPAPPGAVRLSKGNVPGLHWDGAAAPAAPAAAAAPGPRLPPASLAALSRHAVLPPPPPPPPSAPPPQQQQPPPQQQQQQQAAADAALYPDLAELIAPPSAELAALSVQQQQQQQARPPSPYDGAALGLGPQEVGVASAAYPAVAPPPGATCCAPGGGAPPPAPGGGGVAEVRRRQTIRDVHISAGLLDAFLAAAAAHTARGIEFCGILAGTLSADDAAFTVSALLLPKQEGTSDTVAALCEEDIFAAQDARGLYPLGWVHTHPTQSCFLSSVDVHTQCGYQTMLDEAVAVVLAPRDPAARVGIFRLTTPGGLRLVQRCAQRGFHTHPPTETGQPLYELCGHVYLNPRAGFEVLDLR